MNITQTTFIISEKFFIYGNGAEPRNCIYTIMNMALGPKTMDEKQDVEERILEIRAKPNHCRTDEELKPLKKKELQKICRNSKMKNWSKLSKKKLIQFIKDNELSQLGTYYDNTYNRIKKHVFKIGHGQKIKNKFVEYVKKLNFASCNPAILYHNSMVDDSKVYLYAHPEYHNELISWGETMKNLVQTTFSPYWYNIFCTAMENLKLLRDEVAVIDNSDKHESLFLQKMKNHVNDMNKVNNAFIMLGKFRILDQELKSAQELELQGITSMIFNIAQKGKLMDEQYDLEERILEIRAKPNHCRTDEELKPLKKKELQKICRDSKMRQWSKLNKKKLIEFIKKRELRQLGAHYDYKYNREKHFYSSIYGGQSYTLFCQFERCKEQFDKNGYLDSAPYAVETYSNISNELCKMYLYSRPKFHDDLIDYGSEMSLYIKHNTNDEDYQIFVIALDKLKQYRRDVEKKENNDILEDIKQLRQDININKVKEVKQSEQWDEEYIHDWSNLDEDKVYTFNDLNKMFFDQDEKEKKEIN